MKNIRTMCPHKALSRVAFGAILLTTSLFSIPAHAQYDWLQFGFLPDKTGNNTLEKTITLSNVSGLQPLFTAPLSHNPDGAPVLLTGVTTPSGVKDLIFVFAEQGYTTAYDANTGTQVWTRDFSTGVAVTGGPSYPNFNSAQTSNTSPAIDPNRLYVYTFGMDGNVHKLKVGDGSEITGGGWPERILNDDGKARGALTIAKAANGHTYLYGNAENKQGHMTTIDLGTGTQHTFNTSNSQEPDTHSPTGSYTQANPWSRGPAYNAALDRVFYTTGTYTNFVPGNAWPESMLGMAPDGHTDIINGGGYPVDSYTPSDWQSHVNADGDLGSANIIQLPTVPGSKYANLGIIGAKDSVIRLLNLADLSGQGAPGKTGGDIQKMSNPLGKMIRAQGTSWTNPADGTAWAFLPGDGGIVAIQMTVDGSGNPTMTTRWTLANGWTTSSIIANGVLFAAVGGGEHSATTSTHFLQAINPTTGAVVWSAPIGQFHWASPIVANGIVYMSDGNSGGFGSGTDGSLHAWKLSTGSGPLANGTYKIVDLNSGLAMDVKGNGTANGSVVQQYAYHGATNEQWKVTNLGGNIYQIIGVQSGRALEVTGAGTANGTGIDIYNYTGATNQQWALTSTGGGNFRLTPQNATGSSMDVLHSGTANGNLLEIYTYNGGKSQQWSFQAP
ncbi:MAG TPA: RICIN domain-containing protein [Acidobacteriaceae bacterium]|nr:RICIN domain-containing protein [Acidobacteriaceae bacterium]